MIRNRNHSLLLRAAVLFVCAVLLIPQASFAAKAQNNTVSSVRVLLTRLNLADEAWMTLEGRYLARGSDGTEVLLPPGAQLTVLLRGGKLVLFHDGLSLNAGKELTLLRRRDGALRSPVVDDAHGAVLAAKRDAEPRWIRRGQTSSRAAWAAIIRPHSRSGVDVLPGRRCCPRAGRSGPGVRWRSGRRS